MPIKVIIDTDPGIDDAMAILFAYLSKKIDLIGLTTVFGNVSVDQATTNALTLVELFNANIPVAKGTAKPIVKELKSFPDFVHGKNGFGDIETESPKSSPVQLNAVDFIIEQIMSQPGEICLVPIGPLTNIALALEKEPKIQENVKEVVFMGGAVSVNGNVTPAAEANMLSDPHAADKALTADWPITMIGLDVTHEIVMTDDYIRKVHNKNSLCGDFIYDICKFYLDFHRSVGREGLFTHDPAAIAYVINPDLFKTKQGEVRVVTEGISIGQTVMNLNGDVFFETPWSNIPKASAALSVDEKGVLDLYEQTILPPV